MRFVALSSVVPRATMLQLLRNNEAKLAFFSPACFTSPSHGRRRQHFSRRHGWLSRSLFVTGQTRNAFHRFRSGYARLHWTPKLCYSGRERRSHKIHFKYRARAAARLGVAEVPDAFISPGLAITSISYYLLTRDVPTWRKIHSFFP